MEERRMVSSEITSESRPPSEEVLERIRERRERRLEDYRAFDELRQAMEWTPEERRQREQLIGQICEKLGFAEELEALRELSRDRARRMREVVDKHSRAEDDTAS